MIQLHEQAISLNKVAEPLSKGDCRFVKVQVVKAQKLGFKVLHALFVVVKLGRDD